MKYLKTIFYLILLLTVLLLQTACKPDEESQTESAFLYQVLVRDEGTSLPIKGAEVRLLLGGDFGPQFAITDDNGIAIIRINLDSVESLVPTRTVSANGYQQKEEVITLERHMRVQSVSLLPLGQSQITPTPISMMTPTPTSTNTNTPTPTNTMTSTLTAASTMTLSSTVPPTHTATPTSMATIGTESSIVIATPTAETSTELHSVIEVDDYIKSVTLCVQVGDLVHWSASGIITVGQWVGNVGPDGKETIGIFAIDPSYDIVPALPHAVLMARVEGDGEVLAVNDGWVSYASTREFIAEKNGCLAFDINDNINSDNSGAFSVEVTIIRQG